MDTRAEMLIFPINVVFSGLVIASFSCATGTLKSYTGV